MDGDVIEAGRLFLVSSVSSRESHDNLALFQAKAPLAVLELRARYLAEHPAEHPAEAEEYSFEPHRFVAWLAQSGLVEEVPFAELFLGAYGDFRPELKARGGVAGASTRARGAKTRGPRSFEAFFHRDNAMRPGYSI